ncbi:MULTISPECIES: fumarylacetoacetate hydrolase family protein [unclassified Oceanobacillus]|uniref:fumarylacetoacetate hydrolase family protein n=1 Tax=unclassified Oceanobacillus TaxID=2630292 RepID=UPI001BEC1E0A|nr:MULTISPECIES: fumarylacetoacetate hydrolase family protein [unclassified Oceanobacillus]MBT2600516.1 fumarylacetoacetate hydrolase family protein [Oceanobacillus sp. ISL-74]MBT2650674.1 fumarylacetoacetate hydrolase family protein [Oceanobacillus sp. ISL-73]
MRLLTFQHNEQAKVGIQQKETVYDLQKLTEQFNQANDENLLMEYDLDSIVIQNEEVMESIISVWQWAEKNIDSLSGVTYKWEDVKILAPVNRPGKLVCVGNNYMDHCIEQDVEPPKKPMIFSKWASCIIGPDDAIKLPEESVQVDYEAELAVVIGKKGKNITEEEALDYVFGYTIINDVSARDIQFEDVQWVRGKSYDTFAPIGPVIVTKDEIEDPHQLDITLELNGEKLQDSNTTNLIFDIPYIISYLSKGFTFEPGDIIATGTPHGVGVFRDPQVFLKSGDTCTIEIENIGVLENTVD